MKKATILVGSLPGSERGTCVSAFGGNPRPPLADKNPAQSRSVSLSQALPIPDFKNRSLAMASFFEE